MKEYLDKRCKDSINDVKIYDLKKKKKRGSELGLKFHNWREKGTDGDLKEETLRVIGVAE